MACLQQLAQWTGGHAVAATVATASASTQNRWAAETEAGCDTRMLDRRAAQMPRCLRCGHMGMAARCLGPVAGAGDQPCGRASTAAI